jgi:hypothetical protein
MKRTIGIILLALALTGVISLSLKEYRLALFGKRSQGVVTRVEKVTTSNGSDGHYRNGRRTGVKHGSELTFMYIDFTTPDGQARQVKTLATFHTTAAVGGSHPMIYLPAQPETAKIYSAPAALAADDSGHPLQHRLLLGWPAPAPPPRCGVNRGAMKSPPQIEEEWSVP